MNTTSKAVGGAITQAKGALSTWWSAMTTVQPPQQSDNLTGTAIKEEEKGEEEESGFTSHIEIVPNSPTARANVQEIASEAAEEFLESEMAEARSETQLGGGHKEGEVFSV